MYWFFTKYVHIILCYLDKTIYYGWTEVNSCFGQFKSCIETFEFSINYWWPFSLKNPIWRRLELNCLERKKEFNKQSQPKFHSFRRHCMRSICLETRLCFQNLPVEKSCLFLDPILSSCNVLRFYKIFFSFRIFEIIIKILVFQEMMPQFDFQSFSRHKFGHLVTFFGSFMFAII